MASGSERRRAVHAACGAGQWFPGDPASLRAAVDRYLAEAQVPHVPGRIVAGIAPHAGYRYSGPVAGCTFRALRDADAAGRGPATVVLLGFGHRVSVRGAALLEADAFATPLGEAPLDVEAAERLVEGVPGAHYDTRPHDWEHSAENLVPFVQAALPSARLVVALIDGREPTLAGLAAGLAELARERALCVVASTDLLHDPDYALVSETDRATLGLMETLDESGLAASWSPARQVCCGIGPVRAAMRFACRRGAARGRVLCYRNSGDDFPESRGSWVVGYGAVVFAVDA